MNFYKSIGTPLTQEPLTMHDIPLCWRDYAAAIVLGVALGLLIAAFI
jgi:hypothetical protein